MITDKTPEKMMAGRGARYSYLLKIIEKHKCKSILEIGTCKCESAVPMIEKAKANGRVVYYGFDLFEEMTEDIFEKEKSLPSETYVRAANILEATGAEIHLFRGMSFRTIPFAKQSRGLEEVDLIFIDGGHSYLTAKTDWEYIQSLIGENTVVIIDDYMPHKAFGVGPTKVVDEIDRGEFIVEFPTEAFDSYSRMVKVTRRTQK